MIIRAIIYIFKIILTIDLIWLIGWIISSSLSAIADLFNKKK